MTKTASQLPVFLSPQQLADHLGVCRKTIYRWIKAGDLPAVRVGGVLRVSIVETERWMKLQALGL